MPQDVRIAVLTDVHGNAFAAQAVAADIRRSGPDIVLNLGDQSWGQADPAGALHWQRSLGAVEVRGNNDERLTDAALRGPRRQLQDWLRAQLPEGEGQRLSALPLTTTVADGAVLAAHGTPESPWDSLLLHWDGTYCTRRPAQEVRKRLSVPDGVEVVLVGHMHREDQRLLDGRLLVNVGAVSWQNDGDPRARWATLTRRAGVWSVQHRRVTYDWQAAADWIRANQPPDPTEAEMHTDPVHDPLRDLAGDTGVDH